MGRVKHISERVSSNCPYKDMFDLRLLEYAKSYCHQKRSLFESRLRELTKTHSGNLQKAISYYLDTGGKRFRSLLVVLSCEAVGGKDTDAIDLACSLEYIHASSVILDDLQCMDASLLRRGKLTLHRKYGEALAILTAVYFLNRGYEIASRSSMNNHNLCYNLSTCIDDMLVGQILDLKGLNSNKHVQQLKTGSLMILAAKFGAHAGCASKKEEAVLINYANNLGIAFQLRDDIIDGENIEGDVHNARKLAYEAILCARENLKPSRASKALAGLAIYAVHRSL